VLNILSRRLAYAQSTDCGNHVLQCRCLHQILAAFPSRTMKQVSVSSTDHGGGTRRSGMKWQDGPGLHEQELPNHPVTSLKQT
jgi:hypothetical protein